MYDALFAPLTLGDVEIPNRIARTAHGTRLTGADFEAYHRERARGEVGLTILQIAGVHESSPTPALPGHSDAILPIYESLMRTLAPYEMRVFQQLWHGGAAVIPSGSDTPTLWSASAVPHPRVGIVPHPMTQGMIDEVVAGFAASARRARDGGLHGVELHAAHSYLLGQFLSPALNHREDGYGGDLAGRTRLLREALVAIRAEVGAGFPVGVRLSADDLIPDGIGPAEALAIAREVEEHVDFVDLTYGGHWSYHDIFATMEAPLGYELPSSEQVTRALTKPTIVTGRIMTLDHAAGIVEAGDADMVSMVRALIADPYLVAKARRGDAAAVRPCISSNQGCVGGIKAGRIGCSVNPAAGHEAVLPFEPEPAASPRHVAVIGGGPAGLEAARTAAVRGHRVTLFEARRFLGGQCHIAASVPERSDLGAIAAWLAGELERLGVTVRTGVFADADVIRETGADEVVVASGSSPERDAPSVLSPASAIPGSRLPHVRTSWEALGFGGSLGPGDDVVVYDDTGTLEAATVALSLMRERRVSLVTRFSALGFRMPYPAATVEPVVERLLGGGVTIVASTDLAEISLGHVSLVPVGGGPRRDVPADAVVLVTTRVPSRDLLEELDEEGIAYRLAGDVNGTDDLQRAIHDGAAVGRDL